MGQFKRLTAWPVLLLVLAGPAAADDAPPCALRLAAVARYTPLPPREQPVECAVDDLVRLDRIIMPDRPDVTLEPAPTLRCPMAEAVAEWLRGDVAPLASGLGAPLAAVSVLDAYECRPRNRVPGAKISEHGKGNALDVGAVKLGNGRVFTLTDPQVSKPFREAMRGAACARFTTVLGPGSDGYHNEHIHLDLAVRSHGYRICQWDVLDPAVAGAIPLPRGKPAALLALQAKSR